MVVQDAVRGEYVEETKLLLDRGGKIHEGGKVGRLPSESANPVMRYQQAFLLPAYICQIHPRPSVFLLHLVDACLFCDSFSETCSLPALNKERFAACAYIPQCLKQMPSMLGFM